MIQSQIYDALTASADVSAIASSRIYPVRLPREAVLPAVVYQVPIVSPVSSMSGDSGIDNCTVNIVCWAKEYAKAHDLAYAVRKALVESGLRIITEGQNDEEDLETHSYGVSVSMNIWSESNTGVPPVSEDNAMYIGDPNINGSWKIEIDGATLVVYRRESAVWVEKGGYS
jgi:hypothetical protein